MATSTKKTNSNRKNAKKSTGPKTAHGKEIVAKNRLTHGLRSIRPVLPGTEDADAWQHHSDAILAELAPVGSVEFALAQRVAFGFWRLARCAEVERRILSALRARARLGAIEYRLYVEKIDEFMDLPGEESLRRFRTEAQKAQTLKLTWETVTTGSDQDEIAEDYANALIWNVLPESLEEQFDADYSNWPPATVGEARAIVGWIADQTGKEAEEIVAARLSAASEEAARLDRIFERMDKAAAIAEDLAMLGGDQISTLSRYETTIHRALLRDIHELQRLQTIRSGAIGNSPPE